MNNILKGILNDSSEIIYMNSLNITYNNMLGKSNEYQENYKRYINQLLQENIPGIVFIRPPARNQLERVCSSASCS